MVVTQIKPEFILLLVNEHMNLRNKRNHEI